LQIAAERAHGDFIGFLNPTDTLSMFTLYEVVKTINDFPDVDFIYGDDDNIIDLKRDEPDFKPDFAPDTLRSTNYIGDFFFVKRKLLAKVEESMECIGDFHYEMILHAAEQANRFFHIPKILNHKRCIKTSSEHNKKIGINSDLIKSHITRDLELDCTVEYTGFDDIYKVDYILNGQPKVSILIPNKDHLELLRPCIESIQKLTTYNNYEIVIIENNSKEKETFEYYEELGKIKNIKVVYYPEKEFNYQKIINFGVKNCDTDFILQLNNDIELITPDWLEIMLGYAQRNDVGAVGVKLFYPDKSIQHAGGVLIGNDAVCDHMFRFMPANAYGYRNRDQLIKNVSWVTGACMLCSKETYERVGYMTEDFEKFFGDADFCMKIRVYGKSVIYNPYVELIHHEGKTRGHCESLKDVLEFEREREMFKKKWNDELKRGDLFNDPNMEKILFD